LAAGAAAPAGSTFLSYTGDSLVARPQPQREGSNLTPFYVILGVVALVGVGVLFTQMRGGTAAAATGPQAITVSPEELRATQGIAAGAADAPVVVLEFGDFQCNACGEFARFSKPLVNEFIEDGTVRFVWYDFPLSFHQNAFLAARAGRCANEQDGFWPYHDVVFGQMDQWANRPTPTGLFTDYAERVGLDRRVFEQCLNSDRYQREVTQNAQFGQSLGVQGTPTIFVNGQRLHAWPRSRAEWQQVIESARGGTPLPGADHGHDHDGEDDHAEGAA
jgi:protein-disulfide isomerase